MNILHEDCDPTLANDKKLPYNAYLVEYTKEDRIAYDVTMGHSEVEIFDSYYDKYKKGFKTLKQSSGTIKPSLWNGLIKPQKKKVKEE